MPPSERQAFGEVKSKKRIAVVSRQKIALNVRQAPRTPGFRKVVTPLI